MKDYQTYKPDFSEQPYDSRRAATDQKPYGWRYSVHNGWANLEPNGYSGYDDWSHEGAEFLCRLGEENPQNAIKVVAQSRDGKTIKEVFIDPSDFEDAQHKLLELKPESVNLLFDPVPWVKGKRKRKTRFGWITMSGVHPLSSFPEPVAYWAVGPHAYQALLPWHMPVKIRLSCEQAEYAVPCWPSGWSESKASDLLVMPGSIIHAGSLPPFTALMKYDMFSVSEVEDQDTFLQQY